MKIRGGFVVCICIAAFMLVALSCSFAYALVSHSASQVTAGMFGIGDYTFNGSLGVQNSIGSSLFFVNYSSGYVGIGTTTPQGQLSINNQIPQASPLTYNVVSQNVLNGYYSPVGTPYTRYFDIAAVGAADTTNGDSAIRFLTNTVTSSVASERMRITGTGNVGIGTASPSHKLNVVGDTNITGNVIIGGNLSGGSPVKIVGGVSLLTGGITAGGTPQRGIWNSRVPLNNIITTISGPSNTQEQPTITIGADGLPVIAYYHSNGCIAVIKCGDSACASGNVVNTTVDCVGGTGGFFTYASIAIGIDGFPVIAYLDRNNNDFKVTKCGDASCSSGNIKTTIDSAGAVGVYASITIGTDGLPVASYQDNTNANLKVLKCGNTACSSGNTITTADNSTADVGSYTSITLGTDGFPVISYYNTTGGNLMVLKCGNVYCNESNTKTAVDSTNDIGQYTSITIGTDGLPVVSYYDVTNGDLKVAKCGNVACNASNTITTVDSTGNVGEYTSITIGTDGLPIVSYHDFTNGVLKFVKCGNAACSSGNTFALGDSGIETSIAIGADGLPVALTYYAFVVKVTKCGSDSCIPYWTRR